MTIVVIPCYQGSASVGDVVRGARATGLQVVVVDDGSSDGSATAAEAAGATVLRHPANRGKGAALASGFAYAKKIGATAVLTMDADGQHDPGELPALLAAHAASPTAVIVGVRSFRPEDMPRRSRIGNRISTWWISKYAGMRYSDTQSGFRVYPSAMFDVPLKSTKFDTETELLLRAAKMKLPLVEVPIKTIYRTDHSSHFHGFRDTMRVIKLVFFSPLWVLLLALAFAVAGCAHAPPPPTLAPTAATWKTMRAEHRVTIEAGGQKRTVRGLIAVEKPDRFRLRALGPAGITLFDIVSVAGEVRVIESIKDPSSSALGKILPSMAADLQAAYDLEPRPAGRSVTHQGDLTVVTEPGRTVKETPSRIDIDDPGMGYKVRVDVGAVEKDVTLDPAMWAK
ncbi:MAG: glycosyl transferase family 2 [Myxococcales bacterium]|nr:glycosyl transferase family 2 [Myxococcales bacterium]